MNLSSPYAPSGTIEPRTGRVAVPALSLANSDHCDAPAYWYNADAEDTDPWRLLDGVDPHVDGSCVDVWFASGNEKRVSVDATVYVSAKTAALLKVTS